MSLRCTTSLFALAALAALGRGIAPVHADTITAVDYPNSNHTEGIAVNDVGNMVGHFVDSSGATKAYERFADGTFSAPIVAPGDNAGQTHAYGINRSGTIVGNYLTNTSISTYHGYLLNGSTFTTFDIGSSVSTTVAGINNAGDFVGLYGSSAQANRGFLSVQGKVTTFDGPAGNTGTLALSINDQDVVVGRYTDSSGNTHGYSRDPNTGALSLIDFPGAAQTGPNSINDAGVVAGYYVDSRGNYHGFFLKSGVYTGFDVPGSNVTSTAIVGINSAGVTVGNTTDNSGNFHGFIDIPSPSASHLLWNNTNGQMAVWTVSATGAYSHLEYGPYSGWSAKSVAVGPDNAAHLLWDNVSGQTALWNVTSTGSFTASYAGPYSGWSGTAIAFGADNQERLMWNNTDGQVSVWTLPTASTASYTHLEFGPYSGWSAKSMAVGPDNMVHLLWDNVSGQTALWNVGAAGSFTATYAGPYSGWSGTAIAFGADNQERLLWNNTGGQVSLWTLPSASTSVYSHLDYGPYSAWSTSGVSATR